MWKRVGFTALALASCLMVASMGRAAQVHAAFNQPGNFVVADQFNNRIIEIDSGHHIVWSFGSGEAQLCNPGPGTIIGANDAERFGTFTMMAGTGVPPNTIPEMPAGCVDNRVIIVNQAGQIVWQYGSAGVTGSDFNQLNTPVCDVFLPNNDVLITDQGNERIIEVTHSHNIVWQYGMNGVMGAGFNQLNNPNCAELLANGHILIADENNNRVIEVTRDRRIVWSYGEPENKSILNGAAFASRLPNGNTLITDSGNARVLEITPAHQIAWSYSTKSRPGSIAMPLPTRAIRLETGLTLISDQFNHQVIEVDRGGHIVFAQGQVGVPGNTFDKLYGPYDAKAVGDYTGLTPP